ncbi:MAG: HD domain-containing protein [Archaeoglobus sp.]|nr:HD domain-containing protein [Archaeoglobus sp.]
MEADFGNLARFIQEAMTLKNVPRAGWLKAGIKNPESVAEHSMSTAVISFILAFLETSNFDLAAKAALHALLHDLPEARTLDLHKLAKKYAKIDSKKAFEDQLSLLPGILASKVKSSYEEVRNFVEDADRLELIFQAKEYSKCFPEVMEYVKGLELKTDAARKIKEAMEKEKSWWLYFE